MTRLHWILAAAVLATWIPSYVIFFHRDVATWWRTRGARREQERARLAAAHAAQAQLREELAAKYIPPTAGPRPRG